MCWLLFVSLSVLVSAGCVFDYQSAGSGRLGNGGSAGVGAAGSSGSAGSGGLGGAVGSGGQSGIAGSGGMVGSGGSGTGATGGFPAGDPCTVATQNEDCGGRSCNPITLTCSDFYDGDRGVCQTCVSDQNCWNSGHRCVLMNFQGDPYPNAYTGFCLPEARQDFAGGPYHCNGEEPYFAVLEDHYTTMGAGPWVYCGVREELTTCDAVAAQLAEIGCTAGRDDECPVGGICRYTQDNGKWDYRCTYECTSNSECRNAQGWELNCINFCGG